MSLASSSSCVLLAILALSLFAAATTASSRPSPHATTATASSHPSPHATTATASSGPSPHAATAPAFPRPSPQGHPPADETMEEAPSTLEEEDGGDGDEEERYLLHDLEQLMRDGASAKTTAARLEHLGNVLQLLGFREMAAAVPSLAASPVLAAWPGPLTVFAVPDEALQASCPDCWMAAVLVAHMAVGSFPYAELSSKPQMKVPAVLMGFCFTASASSSTSNVTVSIDGVNVVRPDLYNDGRLVVHGMEGQRARASSLSFSLG